jgi:SSS family solute:Na+ symporter
MVDHRISHLHQSLHHAQVSGQLHTNDIIVLIGYLVITVLFGCYFIRKSRTPEEFTTAGGKLPGWVIGLSIFGTYVSSISFLANPGSSFIANWNAYVFNIACVLATLIAVRYFIPYYRRYNSVSAYTLFENKFGLWARIYASIFFILTAVSRIAAILYLVALPVNQLTGWSIIAIIWVIGAITVIYTLLGGIEGVVYTIAMQSVVLMAGALICIILIFVKMPGGIPAIFKISMVHHKFSLGSFSPSLTQSTIWVVLAFGLATNLQNLGIDQNYVQRYITAKSEHEAKKSAWLSSVLFLLIPTIFFFIGTALFSYYTALPKELTAQMTTSIATGHGDQVFPYFIVHNLHYGLAGIVIAAILAAAMSTISSNLNSSATVINEDYFKRFFPKKATAKNSMRVLYLSTLIFGLIMISGASLMIHVKTALTLIWIMVGIFSGGILGIFLLSLISHMLNRTAVFIGVLAGFLSIVYLSFAHLWPHALPLSHLHQFLTIVVGTLLIAIVGFLVSVLMKKSEN